MPHTIRTERLLLRPVRLSDAPEFTEACNDYDVMKMTAGWPASFDEDYARTRFQKFIDGKVGQDVLFVIVWEGKVVGTIGLHNQVGGGTAKEGEAILGYMFGKVAWGKGLMTEAVKAVCRHGFEQMNFKKITAEHFDDNPASGRVLIKTGFERTGPAAPAFSKARDGEYPGWHYELTRERLIP